MKLADFGVVSAMPHMGYVRQTDHIVTISYRAPESFLGCTICFPCWLFELRMHRVRNGDRWVFVAMPCGLEIGTIIIYIFFGWHAGGRYMVWMFCVFVSHAAVPDVDGEWVKPVDVISQLIIVGGLDSFAWGVLKGCLILGPARQLNANQFESRDLFCVRKVTTTHFRFNQFIFARCTNGNSQCVVILVNAAFIFVCGSKGVGIKRLLRKQYPQM